MLFSFLQWKKILFFLNCRKTEFHEQFIVIAEVFMEILECEENQYFGAGVVW